MTADLNHDGTPDIVAASGVLLAKGDNTFEPFSVFPTAILTPTAGGVDFTPAVADFNGVGNLDVATFSGHPGTFGATLVVFPGRGDGTFLPPMTVGNYMGAFAFAGDFDGDRIPDLVVGSRDYSGFNLLLGNGDGTFRLGSLVYFSNNFLPVNIVAGAMGDFNGDGKVDVAIVDMDAFELIMVTGNGDGTFSGAPFPESRGAVPVGVRRGGVPDPNPGGAVSQRRATRPARPADGERRRRPDAAGEHHAVSGASGSDHKGDRLPHHLRSQAKLAPGDEPTHNMVACGSGQYLEMTAPEVLGHGVFAAGLAQKINGPELGISGPCTQRVAVGGDSPPGMLSVLIK